nr:hypothetical protein [Lentilactobacillus senioris]
MGKQKSGTTKEMDDTETAEPEQTESVPPIVEKAEELFGSEILDIKND